MSDASTPIRSMKRKLTMSADPVTAGQLKLNWLKIGAKAYCMKDNINFVDRNHHLTHPYRELALPSRAGSPFIFCVSSNGWCQKESGIKPSSI